MGEILSFFKRRFLNNKEAKNAIWIIGGKVAQMVLSFFVGVLTARYLGPGQYGIINYVAAYVAFFTAFCTLGLNSIIVKEFADAPDRQGETIGTALVLRGVSSLLSAVMIVAIVAVLDRDEPVTIVVAILCSISLFFRVADTFTYWFQSRYQSKVTSIATLLAYIVTSAYRIVLLITNKSIEWFAFASSVDYLCIAIVLFASYKKYKGQPLSFSWSAARRMLGKSYHFILTGMLVAIYGQTDKLMLKQMLSEEAVGYYALAMTINNMWVFVLAAIIDSITPTIIQLHATDKLLYERKNRQLYAIVLYTSFAVALGFILLGKVFIRVVYGEPYLNAVGPLRIICWYTAFSYLGVARDVWMVCENKQKYLKYITGGAAIANVFLNLALIPRWGASGAAAASLITQIITILIPWFIRDLRPNARLMLDALLLRGVR